MKNEKCFVQNACFEEVIASIQYDDETKIACINSSLVDGKNMLRSDEKNSSATDKNETSSYGIGQLIGFAVDLGARIVNVELSQGISTDEGIGIFASLGASFDDVKGCGFVPTKSTFNKIDGIDFSLMFPRLQGAQINFFDKESSLPVEMLNDVFRSKLGAKDVLEFVKGK